MTQERLHATSATLRWFKRSVERRFDDDVESWKSDPPEDEGIQVQFDANLVEADDSEGSAPVVGIRMVISLEQAQVSAQVDGAVEFKLGADLDTAASREQIVAFVRDPGIPYLLGIERGVLADMTRSVGLPAVMVPPLVPEGLLEDVERALFGSGSAEDDAI